MTENERLTFRTDLGISIDKNEDCPTMSICWNCDIPPRKCKYFKDAIDKLAKYEAIGTIGEFKVLKEKSVAKKPIGEYTQCKCSVCGRRVRSGRGSSSFVRDNFCQRCGQAIDWQ